MSLLVSIRSHLFPRTMGLDSIRGWREYVLSTILLVIVILGTVVAVPSLLLVLSEGLWSIALTDVGALGLVVFLWAKRSLAFEVRAWVFCTLLYLMGASFLITVGVESQIYLMAAPVMAAILLGPRPAFGAIGLSSVTLLVLGYWSHAGLQFSGFESLPLARWMVITVNFALICALITISTALLLHGLETSLDAARSSEDRYRTAFVTSPDAMVITRVRDGTCLDVNDGFLRLLALHKSEVLGKTLRDVNVWRDLGKLDELMDALGREGRMENMLAEFVARDGTVMTGLLSSDVVTIQGEQCILTVARDITEREAVKAALEVSQRNMLAAQRMAHAGSYVNDIASGTWTSTETLDAIFGIDATFVRNVDNWSKLMAPGYGQKMLQYYQEVVTRTDQRFDMEYEIIRPSDGQRRWVHALGEFHYDAQGKPLTLGGLIQDVTERKALDQELLNYRTQLEKLVEQRTQQLAQANKDMAQQRDFIRTVTDAVPSLIGYWDSNLRCGFANHAYQDLFGMQAESLVGMHAQDVLGERLFQMGEPHLRAALQGKAQRFQVPMDWRDGTTRYFALQYLPHTVDNAVVGCYLLADDITELKVAEKQLLGLNQALVAQVRVAEVANQAKSTFLAHMSHEIRTPMNGVVGMMDVLQQTDLAPDQHRMLRTIQQSSLALLKILNDVLDYSKIEAGKLELEQLPTHLRAITQDVAKLMQTAAQAKGVTLSVFVSTDLPKWILSDPTRVRQILLNLVGNAVKFTSSHAGREGQVHVAVEPCSLSHGAAGVLLRVMDNGVGMPPEVLGKLFQPFAQADASTARTYGGTGLGLSITQHLVALLGGTIDVHSTVGEGSEFAVALPLVACIEDALEASGTPPVSAHTTPPRSVQVAPVDALILLAEDNETNREVMLRQLQLLGYRAEVAEDGEVALAMWRDGRYALVLTDCHMPKMDGFQLTQAIRRLEAGTSRIPIIAVTANAMPGEAQHCLEHGMDGYLSKPLRLADLQEILAKWLNVATPEAAVQAPALLDWDATVLPGLVRGSAAVHQRLLERFLEGAQAQVLSVAQAIAASDIGRAADDVHKLCSSARTVGALRLGDLCSTLEIAARAGDGVACQAMVEDLVFAFSVAQAAIKDHILKSASVIT